MEIVLPTVGRIVHYYPVNGDILAGKDLNGSEFFPAIVVQSWGNLSVNITVFLPGGETVGAWSIPHKSEKFDGSTQGYWDWPPRLNG